MPFERGGGDLSLGSGNMVREAATIVRALLEMAMGQGHSMADVER